MATKTSKARILKAPGRNGGFYQWACNACAEVGPLRDRAEASEGMQAHNAEHHAEA